MLDTQFLKMFRRESKADALIPLSGHLTPLVAKTKSGDLVAVFELQGIGFESKSTRQRDQYKVALNNLFRNVYSPRLTIHTHLLRRKVAPDFTPGLADSYESTMHDAYMGSTDSTPFMSNQLYISLVYRVVDYVPTSLFKGKDKQKISDALKDAVIELERIASQLTAGLAVYQTRRLGIRKEQANNNDQVTIKYSEIGEFYSLIHNHRASKVPLGAFDLSRAVANKRILFGPESFEIRGTSDQVYGGCIGVREYQPNTYPEMFQDLWSAPFEFNLSQSFGMIERGKAGDLLKQQINRMRSADDDAVSQIDALSEALDQLASREFIMGDHNLVLTVYSKNQKQLQAHLADASTLLPGMVTTREDLALDAQFRSQLPGNHAFNARNAPITSLNFASFSPFYGFSGGDQYGHHWGEAHCLLKTMVGSPHYFSPHVGDLGNMLILGMTGAGKTTLQNFLLGYTKRFGAKQIVIDKDEGAKISILAFGGEYHSLKIGQATGFNPFDLDETTDYPPFLVNLLTLLANTDQEKCTTEDIQELSRAVDSVMVLPRETRCLQAIESFLDNDSALHNRLRPWINGHLSWVFSNNRDALSMGDLTGFDVTPFLDNATVRTPLLAYLFYRFDRAIEKGRFAFWLDEFWKLLDDEYFVPYIRDKQKTVRKRDGIMVCTTQSPDDALNSPIASAIIEQSSTKIFLPNEYADEQQYKHQLQFSDADWEIFKGLTKTSRLFLLTQQKETKLITFDLSGMDGVLNIISGTEKNNQLLDQIAATHGGTLPANWIDIFQSQIH